MGTMRYWEEMAGRGEGEGRQSWRMGQKVPVPYSLSLTKGQEPLEETSKLEEWVLFSPFSR